MSKKRQIPSVLMTSKKVSNPVLAAKWDKHDLQMHQKELRRIRKNSQNPKYGPSKEKYDQLFKNQRKKELMEEGRYSQIEKDNLRLLSKMSKIMKSGTYSQLFTQPSSSIKSLNKGVRQKQLIKITLENDRLLKRLNSCKSVVSGQWKHGYK